jgi:hypothetical protein
MPLSARFGLTKLDDIDLTLTLLLTVVRTDFIWTKIAYLRKFGTDPVKFWLLTNS